MGVSNKLKILRVTNGDMTQQELADRVSCSRQTIHSIEAGKFTPSVELSLKLAKVLNTTVEAIFCLENFVDATLLEARAKVSTNVK